LEAKLAVGRILCRAGTGPTSLFVTEVTWADDWVVVLSGSFVCGESGNDQPGEGQRAGRRRWFLTAWFYSAESNRGLVPLPHVLIQGRSDVGYIGIYTPKIKPTKLLIE